MVRPALPSENGSCIWGDAMIVAAALFAVSVLAWLLFRRERGAAR
jgi:hypothetical protein